VTCREFTAFIADYLAGEMAEDARRTFAEHLEICENCRRYLSGYEQTVKLGRHAFDDEEASLPRDVPEDLVRAVLAARNRTSS
jgi:predicted anti-sigma-YlaC factor YlaD